MRKIFFIIAILCIVSFAKELSQSLHLGFTNTTGNSRTLDINAKYTLQLETLGYHHLPLQIHFTAQAFYAQNNGIKSNEEYDISSEINQNVTNSWLGYIVVNWLRNPDFKNYNNKADIGIGVGREFIKTQKEVLTGKVGIGTHIEDYADATPTRTFFSFNQYLEYTNKLNAVSSFYAKCSIWENVEDFTTDYEVNTVFGFKFIVGKNLNLSIEEHIDYDNLPPEGNKKTDTKSIVSIGYNF